jgi:hypothetical protein
MPTIDLENSYKTSCKYCGLVKKSLIPGNFVCNDCKKFCEQQLSGEELLERDREVFRMIECLDGPVVAKIQNSERHFIECLLFRISDNESVSNQQYLSVCRILKKVKI